jgi:ABC-type antimicrobial peptide transport system permease subunit
MRMILAARPGQVNWLILRRSLEHMTIGLAIGLAAAMAVGQVLQAFLVQTSTRDPVTLVTIVVLLVVVAFAACVGPARRATRLDPLHALRHE